jgi:hypothetical protein
MLSKTIILIAVVLTFTGVRASPAWRAVRPRIKPFSAALLARYRRERRP